MCCSCVVHACLNIPANSDSHDVLLNIFQKPVEKIQVSFKSNGTSHKVQYTFLFYLFHFPYNENVSDKLCTENRNTNLRSITFI
jgi:hypothetical protein